MPRLDESFAIGGSPVDRRQRVAILGGGVAGLTAALELTATQELRDRYDVTVYQLGWRCGGKCATGRSIQRGARNEEHGLHFWFGGYTNAFRLLKRCYDELGADAPFGSMDDAWTPLRTVYFYDDYRGVWSASRHDFVTTDGHPWDPEPVPLFAEFVEAALAKPKEIAHRLERNVSLEEYLHWMHTKHPSDASLSAPRRALRRYGNRLEHRVTQYIIRRAHSKAWEAESRRAYKWLAAVLRRVLNSIYRRHVQKYLDHDEIRHRWSRLDMTMTALIGFLRDDLLHRDDGIASINHLDFSEWLLSHGLKDVSLEGPDMRVAYDESFANILGPSTTLATSHPLHGKPAFAAGVALYTMIRSSAPYRGDMMYQATAGMGDTAIAPMYDTLCQRKVKFEFFCRVDNLGVAGDHIDTVTVTRQARPRGTYTPLVNVTIEDGTTLRCWPSEPIWDQLEDGETLRQRGVDFEGGDTELDATSVILHHGADDDFDTIVLAIPAAALPPICGELTAASPRFAEMLDNTYTTMTQSFQVWLTKPVTAVGFPVEHGATSSFIEPLDTGCDSSQVLAYEDWPPSDKPAAVWYFCGTMEDRAGDDPARLDDRARQDALDYLDQIHDQWPGAATGGQFDWDLLHDLERRTGRDRFEGQFWRANHTPTERYVQTPPGSVCHRLRPDESGWRNLYLAGDWTRNGWNVGAVEPSVMSGMLASKAICGSPETIAWYSAPWLIDGRDHRSAH
jgi:uncharacterized protein with NAD-binding domain and iron-sulfur cluster